MADVCKLGTAEPLEGTDWIVVEKDETGRFRASGLSSSGDAVLGPAYYDSESQAVGAAQTWAFHNPVQAIYVRQAA